MFKNLIASFLLGLLAFQPMLALTNASDLTVRTGKSGERNSSAFTREIPETRKKKGDEKPAKGASSKLDSRKAKPIKGQRRIAPGAVIDGQSATRLSDGRWLLLGGLKNKEILNAGSIKDPSSGSTESLKSKMAFARAGHTATLLPNGNVLIVGGKGKDGSLVPAAEIFEPETQHFREIQIGNLIRRSEHTTTLLTSGWLLLVGGINEKDAAILETELINAGNFERQLLTTKPQWGRFNHAASLQGDGTVVFSGGLDQNMMQVSFFESYNPETKSFSAVGEPLPPDHTTPAEVSFSLPGNGEYSVSVKAWPVLRFSKVLDVKTVNLETIKLTLDGVQTSIRVVAPENGRLLFVSPATELKPDATYHLELSGLRDQHDLPLSEKIIAFKTEDFCELPQPTPLPVPHRHGSNIKQIIDEDSWIPGDERFKQSDTKKNGTEPPPLEAPKNVTALSGRVLSLSGKPLAGVTVVLQGQETQTDPQGRFFVKDLRPTQSGMVINGETVNSPGKLYGTFEVLVDIDEGKTNVLPYTSYLPVIDKENEVVLDAPTRTETIVTTPRLPGMEVKIAADSVLKMPTGHGMSHKMTDLTDSHQMTKLGITPIPMERPPFPLPQGIEDALLFTLQMHGAKVQGRNGEKRPGLRFTFPNSLNRPPGTRVQFWNYDSTAAGWAWYGYGTVTKDGSKVIPDTGVELEGMQCLSLMTSWGAPGSGPVPGSHGVDGDPVDLQTGLFVYKQTDLVLPDTIPIEITRTYRQNDGQRDFGMGTTHPYNMFISGDTNNYGNLILPDGSKIKFVRDHSNTNEYVAYHTETPTAFYKAELRYVNPPLIDHPSGGWEIKMRDGSKLYFARKTLYGTILGIHSSATALHSIVDRFGNKLTLLRDENLRLMRITSANNKWVEFSYNGTSNIVTQIRDNIGRVVSYAYDIENRLTKVTDVQGGESFYTYDNAHRMLTLKDARGVVNLTNEYDFAGRVKKQTASDGTVYQFAYTPLSNSTNIGQADVTNPRGLIRRMNFNDKAYPVSEVFGVGRPDSWSFSYERDTVSNRVNRITDNWNQKTAFAYDSHGNMLSTTYLEDTPNAITTSSTYTDFNNVATTTDVLSRTSSFSYDTRGQLTAAADWLSRSSSFTYNDRGQLLTATDNLNRTSRFTYERGVLAESEDPTGRKVKQYVDNAGRVTRSYDPMGGATKYQYNKVNRPVHITDPMGRTGALLHDAVGNILEVTDSKGGKIKYTYDSMLRPLTRTDQLNRVETYQYDGYGNLWKATDHRAQITEFSYDIFNRPTLVRYHDNSSTAYSYDEKARVSSVTDSASGTITYGYDIYDRVNSETTATGTVNYAYDVGGRLTSMKAPNQPLVIYAYDTADRVQSIAQDGQTVSFTYDDADRRLSMTLPNGIVAYYTYDTVSQVKSLTYKRGTTVLGDVSFEYDANGRRTHVSGSLAQILSPAPFGNANYDAANQLNSVNSQSLTFDQNGNLTADGTNTYTWNTRDELTAMSGPSLAASFSYDGEGRRTSRTVNGITTTYVYDGLQVVEEHQQSGPVATQLAGALDEVFYRKVGANAEYLLTDALGSTWALADQSGNINTEYKYDVFGSTQQTGQASTTNNSLQFTGRENDGTGLYYYRNRYYAPELKRFISRDPLRESAGENEYSYVRNNPISLTDPLGLQDGPFNPLRDPAPAEYWPVNAAANTVSDLLSLDEVAQAAWDLGNWCLPLSERMWAGTKLAGITALNAFGGAIAGKAFKGVASAIKRLPWGRMSRAASKACFVKGTLIHTNNGLVPIEEISVGDEVLSYNEQTKRTEYERVMQTFTRTASDVLSVTVEDASEPLGVTSEHPFFVRVHGARSNTSDDDGGEWQTAGSLQIGDEILTASGDWSKVELIERRPDEQVYNFEVNRNHNYFVGDVGLLVHNTCGPPKFPNNADDMDKFLGSEGRRIPDGAYPGRNKVVWQPSDKVKITLEQHPYHTNAPKWHKDLHWHVDTPGRRHVRYLPGDPIP